MMALSAWCRAVGFASVTAAIVFRSTRAPTGWRSS